MSFAWRMGLVLTATALVGCGGSGTSGLGPDDAAPDVVVDAGDDGAGDADATVDAGHPAASVPTADIDFGSADCGGTAAGQRALTIKNTGDGDLTWSASLANANFFFIIGPTGSGDPNAGPVKPGASATVTLSANAIAAATPAGTEQDGVLTIKTNDPAHASTDVKVKITSTGATLTLTPQTAAFGVVPVATQAPDVAVALKNTGNKSVKVSFTQPTDAQFSLVWAGAPADVTLAPGASVAGLKARFKPTGTTAGQTTAPIVVTGAACGASATTIPMTGQGTSGVFAYTPAQIDFGATGCGRASALPAAQRTVTVTNSGNSDFKLVSATLAKGAQSPYTVTLPSSLTVAKGGGTAQLVINAKPIPASSAVTDNLYGDTLTITTDITGDTPHPVTLTQTAAGAIIQYSPAIPIAFGNTPLTSTASSNVTVTNVGNAPATVTAQISGGPIFALTNGALGTLAAGDQAQLTASFTPTATGLQNATISLAAPDVLCQPLPQLAVSGTGTNGAVAISPSSVDFALVNCGSRAGAKTVTIRNTGTNVFTWNATLTIGTSYALTLGSTTLQPAGQPGDTSTVTVTPNAIPATSDITPDLYADTLTITTNIVGDTDHVVPIHETARGAILVSSSNDLEFGGVRINTRASQQFTLSNNGNVPAAATLTNTNGVFTFAPAAPSVPAGGGAVVNASFQPTATQAYSDTATVGVTAGTPICGPLPGPITLGGTGTNGAVLVTPTNLDFGRVACGTVASDQSITIQNNGSAPFNWTAQVTAGQGYYTLSAAGGVVDPGNSANLTVTPAAVPSTSETTADLYAGQVTIGTDIAGDTPHLVALHETALGARLAVNVTQLAFGAVTVGQGRDLPFIITNSGNSSANLAYAGYQTPPFTASPDLVPILGGTQLNVTMSFQPTAVGPVNGQSLSIQTSDILCLPLPGGITLSGSGQ